MMMVVVTRMVLILALVIRSTSIDNLHGLLERVKGTIRPFVVVVVVSIHQSPDIASRTT